MKLIKAIYKAPIIIKEYDEKLGITHVVIKYENIRFSGTARLAKEDEGFYSKKVGYNIALSKARIKMLQWYYEQELEKYNQRNLFYQEVTGFGLKESAEIDPLGVFKRNLKHTEARLAAFKSAIDKEKDMLKKYIIGQDKAIESVKRFRRKADNN